MVDFNNNETVGTKAVDIERVLVLERREALLQAKESYNKIVFNGAQGSLNIIRARLGNLLDQLSGMLIRREGKDKITSYYSIVNNPGVSYEDLHALTLDLSVFLDTIQLTRLDNNQVYDVTDIEVENDIKGLD